MRSLPWSQQTLQARLEARMPHSGGVEGTSAKLTAELARAKQRQNPLMQLVVARQSSPACGSWCGVARA
jgi:hypothetical protein